MAHLAEISGLTETKRCWPQGRDNARGECHLAARHASPRGPLGQIHPCPADGAGFSVLLNSLSGFHHFWTGDSKEEGKEI